MLDFVGTTWISKGQDIWQYGILDDWMTHLDKLKKNGEMVAVWKLY